MAALSSPGTSASLVLSNPAKAGGGTPCWHEVRPRVAAVTVAVATVSPGVVCTPLDTLKQGGPVAVFLVAVAVVSPGVV